MNDERLEQLLKQALIPEIKEDDLKMKRKTGSSRRGTPCLTYRVWIFAGCVRVGAPCFSYKLIAIHLFLLMLRFFRVFFINQREKVLSINTWTIQSIQ